MHTGSRQTLTSLVLADDALPDEAMTTTNENWLGTFGGDGGVFTVTDR